MNGNPITEAMRSDALKRLSDGETMASICRNTEGYPQRSVFVEHFGIRPEWQEAYRKARKDGFDSIAEDAYALVSSPYPRLPDGRIDPAVVQARKLEFDGKLKLLAKWDPIRYGELLKLSGDPSNPFPIGVATIPADIDPQLAAQLYQKALGG